MTGAAELVHEYLTGTTLLANATNMIQCPLVVVDSLVVRQECHWWVLR
jgi:hypothetical protein